jgi:hypothetical protein
MGRYEQQTLMHLDSCNWQDQRLKWLTQITKMDGEAAAKSAIAALVQQPTGIYHLLSKLGLLAAAARGWRHLYTTLLTLLKQQG